MAASVRAEFGRYPREALAVDIAELRRRGVKHGGIIRHWRMNPPGTTRWKPEAPNAPPAPPAGRTPSAEQLARWGISPAPPVGD